MILNQIIFIKKNKLFLIDNKFFQYNINDYYFKI